MRYKSLYSLIVLLFGVQAQAGILHVSPVDLKVYYAATPTLEVQLLNLGADGGLLSMSLKYDGKNVEEDLAKVHEAYPGYQVVQVVLEPDSPETLSGSIEITAVGFKIEFPMKSSPEGIYLNQQHMISVEQTRQLVRLGQSVFSDIKINLPVRDSERSYGGFEMRQHLEIIDAQ